MSNRSNQETTSGAIFIRVMDRVEAHYARAAGAPNIHSAERWRDRACRIAQWFYLYMYRKGRREGFESGQDLCEERHKDRRKPLSLLN